MTLNKSKTPAGAEAGGREECNAPADQQAPHEHINGCAIFKLPMAERRALQERARANLLAAADCLDSDPPQDRCAACGLRIDPGPPHARVRNGLGARVAVHNACFWAMRAGWRP